MPSTKLSIGPISPAAPGPLYQQIIDGIKREIAAGRLAPDTALPSFRVLAESLLVSMITVKRAYEELERDGLVRCHQGLGTFVTDQGETRLQAAQEAASRTALRDAIAAARQARLSDNELLDILRQELGHYKGERP
jgi:GntR family transcriptional regulator